VDLAREGGGPTLIEARCTRLLGHAQHDDAFYVPREILEDGWKNDPVTKGENLLLERRYFTREEIDRKMPEIERFAEIGSFMDQAVKTYSSGMYVRLAFAIAINLDPEILLVDEALAVGDVYFQQRCVRRLRRMRDEGKTILLVSHDVVAVRNLCDAAIWLEKGRVRDRGAPDKVTARYLAALTQRRDPYAGEKASDVTQLEPDAAGAGRAPARDCARRPPGP